MGFFMSLAQAIINAVKACWTVMANAAAAVLNATFGAFTGQHFDPNLAGGILWGGVGFIVVVLIVLKKGFAIKE